MSNANALKYYILVLKSNDDKFLQCKNIQEQKEINNFDSRVEHDPRHLKIEEKRNQRKGRNDYNKKRQKILKRSAERQINEFSY